MKQAPSIQGVKEIVLNSLEKRQKTYTSISSFFNHKTQLYEVVMR